MMEHNKEHSHTLTKMDLQQRLQQLLTALQLDDAPAGGAVVVYHAGECRNGTS